MPDLNLIRNCSWKLNITLLFRSPSISYVAGELCPTAVSSKEDNICPPCPQPSAGKQNCQKDHPPFPHWWWKKHPGNKPPSKVWIKKSSGSLPNFITLSSGKSGKIVGIYPLQEVRAEKTCRIYTRSRNVHEILTTLPSLSSIAIMPLPPAQQTDSLFQPEKQKAGTTRRYESFIFVWLFRLISYS